VAVAAAEIVVEPVTVMVHPLVAGETPVNVKEPVADDAGLTETAVHDDAAVKLPV
jgi:hypothetical protein